MVSVALGSADWDALGLAFGSADGVCCWRAFSATSFGSLTHHVFVCIKITSLRSFSCRCCPEILKIKPRSSTRTLTSGEMSPWERQPIRKRRAQWAKLWWHFSCLLSLDRPSSRFWICSDHLHHHLKRVSCVLLDVHNLLYIRQFHSLR